jgi:VanZ family protein
VLVLHDLDDFFAMTISRQVALGLLAALLAILLFGTQMPGAWRDEAFRVTHLPWQLTKVAHFVIFAGMAAVAHTQPLCWPVARVALWALVLALLTEGLQHFASNRDPSWLDVAIDLGGTAVGVWLARLKAR